MVAKLKRPVGKKVEVEILIKFSCMFKTTILIPASLLIVHSSNLHYVGY